MIWLKSVGLGFVAYLLVGIVATMTAMFLLSPEVSTVELLAKILTMSIIIWYCFAGVCLLSFVQQIKIGLRPFLIRSFLLWGPINFGWYMLVHTGKYPWFLVGMFISSVLLCYELLVLQTKVTRKR
jgi:hypothetical protein